MASGKVRAPGADSQSLRPAAWRWSAARESAPPRAFFRRAACIRHAIDDAFGGAIRQGIHAAREIAAFTAGGQRAAPGRVRRGVSGGIQQVCYRIGRVCRPLLAQQQQIDGAARACAERAAPANQPAMQPCSHSA